MWKCYREIGLVWDTVGRAWAKWIARHADDIITLILIDNN